MRKRFLALLLFLSFGVGSGVLCAGAKHQVQKGETFYSISRAHGVSVASLMRANGFKDPRKLQLGQKLTIPSKKAAVKKKASSKGVSLKVTKTRSTRPLIIIDPGHGGKDRGASRRGVDEAVLNLQVAKRLERELGKRGFRTKLTRRSDYYVSLKRRAAIANRYSNAVFVSVHFNADETLVSSARGVETYYAGAKGKRIASEIQRQVSRSCRLRNRGIKYEQFAVLRRTNVPAVLIECGYMSNPSELRRVTQKGFQQQVAVSIASALSKTL